MDNLISSAVNNIKSLASSLFAPHPQVNSIGQSQPNIPPPQPMNFGQAGQNIVNNIGSQHIPLPVPQQFQPTFGQAFNTIGGPDMLQGVKETAQAWGRVPMQTTQWLQNKPITPNPDLSQSAQRGMDNIQFMAMGGPAKIPEASPIIGPATKDAVDFTKRTLQDETGAIGADIKGAKPVGQAVEAQLKPDASLISSAKGIGEGKIPLQGSTVGGALSETKNMFGTGQGTTDVQNALRANRGQFDLSKDQLIRESAPLAKEWSKLTPEDNVKFIQDIQSGTPQANPRLQQLADQYRVRFNQDYQLAKELKPNLPYMENYFAQSGVWADTNAAKSFYQKFSLGGTPGAVQQRVFPTIQDGINAGLRLKETNPETIALNSRIQLLKAHMGQDFQEAQLAKGVPQEKIDAVLQKYLTPGLQGSKIYQTVRQGNAALNSLQLGFSGFHVAGTAINASVSKAGMAIKALTMGHPLDAMKNILQTPTASLEYIFKGNQILKDVRAGNTTEDIANIAGGGGRLRTPEVYQGVGFQTALQNMRSDNWATKLKGGLQTIPATIETAAKPIMEWWVPRLKAGAAADLISTNLKRLPAGASEEEINAVRANAINSIDNRFGQLNMDNLFWDKTFKDLLALGTRSPGWNIGTIRELGGGIKDMGNLKQLFSGKGISDRSAYTLALPVVVGMLGASYQLIHTGQGPQEIKDYFYPKTGQTDPKTGNPERVSFPTYAKDVYSFMTNPLQTVANKLSPIASIGSQVINNKDYYGNSITDPYANKLSQAGQMGKYIATAVSPFALTGGAKRVDPSLGARAENFMGITKAPGTITNPGQQDYYNASAEMQNLNTQFASTTRKIASGDLTQQQGQSQLQDIYNRQQNAKAIVDKGLPTGAGAQPVTHNPAIVATPGGLYSYVDTKGIVHKNLTQVKAQQMQTKDTSGVKITKTDGSTIDLTPPTKGQGIYAFTNKNWGYTKADELQKAKDNGLITNDQYNQGLSKLGVTPQQADYNNKASMSTDIKTQYLMSQVNTMTHSMLLQQLVSGRVMSAGGNQFASNAVLTNLYNNGTISKSEQTTLNNIKVNSQGNSLTTATGGRVSTGGRKNTGGIKLKKITPRKPTFSMLRRKRVTLAKSKRVKIKKIAFGKVKLQSSKTKSPSSLQLA
jgi:hypothetical protein